MAGGSAGADWQAEKRQAIASIQAERMENLRFTGITSLILKIDESLSECHRNLLLSKMCYIFNKNITHFLKYVNRYYNLIYGYILYN